jgi:hypothetical protein
MHLSSYLSDTAGVNPSTIKLVIDDLDAVGVFELGTEYIESFQRIGRAGSPHSQLVPTRNPPDQ